MKEIVINFSNDSPLYMQIYEKLKVDIMAGFYRKGDQLPSKRKLASHLKVSINTVESAYQQLIAEGYVESRPKQGIFVQRVQNEDVFAERTQKASCIPDNKNNPYTIDFSQGNVDIDHFPIKVWRKCSLQALDHPQILHVGHEQGEYELREELSQYLYRARGVQCSPDQIVIGAGTQNLLILLGMLFEKGSILAFEDPGYHRAKWTFQKIGMSICPIPVEEDGLSIEQLLSSKANIVYCTPSHQFPLGMIMPIHQRQQLIKWAYDVEGYIIEDDYDGEFRYEGRPIPALQGLDQQNRVIYLGTFSKSLVPSLRVNYLVLPPTLLAQYKESLSLMKQSVSKINQQTLALFMKEGHWEKHINKMRTLYRKKQQILIQSIQECFQREMIVRGEKSGLHIILQDQRNRDEQKLITKAMRNGIRVYETSQFYSKCKQEKTEILIGYGGVSLEEIQTGIRTLGEAWR
ncbi:PLP-dependent aminotransferase family protein [Bacillus salitolerans]|uniref:PLP-dependent aminotransferase family protein n=1 Tax=Bacillus salitolerans TaxID=1437434 RepID=A0ABW4LJS6_9BACI